MKLLFEKNINCNLEFFYGIRFNKSCFMKMKKFQVFLSSSFQIILKIVRKMMR